MKKEELEKYAYENRKRLDAQEVKIGDVVKVLRGQFAGKTGFVVGIMACVSDYTDPYYEVDMDCEVPDKYKCRKNTLAQPNNVIGGLSAYEFEVIGNRAPMQSTEEIKVGDKVRVSKDAPRIYTQNCLNLSLHNTDFEVANIEDGCANIQNKDGILTIAYVIPTQYLTKVEDEAKEPKFKVGDVVRMKDGYYKEELCGCIGVIRKIDGCHIYVEIDSTIYPATIHSIEPYTEPTAPTIKVGDRVCCYNVIHIKGSKKEDYMGTVTSITDMGIMIQLDNGGAMLAYHESDLELVQPKEQTEAENINPDDFKKIAEEWANEVSNAIEKYGDAMCKIYVEARNEAYWDAYAADLAKEIAVKLSKPNENKPGYVADYAVSVAKAVVENLKKK